MMHIHTPSVPPVRSAKAAAQSLLAVAIVLGATDAPLAADCLEQPNVQAGQGGRWYYWRDTINHRKCWYQQQQSSSMDVSTAQSRAAVDGTKSLSSFLASLFSGRLSAAPNAPQQNAPQQQAAATATTPAPSAEPGPAEKTSPSYERHRSALHAKRTDGLAPADQKKSGSSDQQYLDPAQREALFQEFLRWAAWQDQARLFYGQ